MVKPADEAKARKVVREMVARELPPDTPCPSDDEDMVKSGALDSMGWVGVLSGIEDLTGIGNFGSTWPEGTPQSVNALVRRLMESGGPLGEPGADELATVESEVILPVSLVGWGHVLGSQEVESAALERECGLATGTLASGAGIESLRRAARDENEVTLALRAARAALDAASTLPEAVDLLVVTSATFLQLPSLAAVLHGRLLLRESCTVLDVGGACVGLLHALATARAFLSARRGRALVVASEVHSRRLAKAPGEFRGLFGDAACALMLSSADSAEAAGHALTMGDFIFGCAGAFASALRLSLDESGDLVMQFKGEQLASAAVNQLARIVNEVEMRCGEARSAADFLCIHEPNPRLVEVFAQRARVPLQKVPLVSKTCGNLGSATCGVSLCAALSRIRADGGPSNPPLIFMAAVGPGLLWGGTWLAGPVRLLSGSMPSAG